jgi:hypothetical protein
MLRDVQTVKPNCKYDSRKMRLSVHLAGMGERRSAHWILAGRREGRGPLGRPRRRWEDNIKMDL